MTISIRLSTLTILGLILSGPSSSPSTFSSGQAATSPSAAAPQSVEKEAKVDATEVPKSNSPDQNGNYRIGGNVVAPKVIHSVEPKIAKKDRKVAKSGITLIQITVEKDGGVQNAHVLKSSAERMKPGNDQAAAVLDQSALDAVNQYRFEPATLDG